MDIEWSKAIVFNFMGGIYLANPRLDPVFCYRLSGWGWGWGWGEE